MQVVNCRFKKKVTYYRIVVIHNLLLDDKSKSLYLHTNKYIA